MITEKSDNIAARIYLIDDHQLFREGLQAILETHGIDVVGSAGTAAEALQTVSSQRPDIILLDLHLGDADGVDCIEPLRSLCSAAKIILLTADESSDALNRGLQHDVDGYLLKTMPALKLVEAISDALTGAIVLPTGLKRQTPAPLQPSPENQYGLTPREREILHWLSEGKSNHEIGVITDISENTVKSHVKKLMSKFKVNNRVLLAKVAVESGYSLPR